MLSEMDTPRDFIEWKNMDVTGGKLFFSLKTEIWFYF